MSDMSPPHYIMLAKLYAKQQQQEASLHTLKDGWNNYTGDKTLGLLYAQALTDNNLKSEATDILKHLTESHPTDDEVLISGALIHVELKNLEEAEKLLLIATESKQKDSAWHFLGQLYEQQDMTKQAIEAFLQVKKGNNFIPAISRAANLKSETQGIEAAQEMLRNLHEQHPLSTPRLIQIEAELLRENSNYPAALALYNEALTLEPQDQNLLYGRAMVLDFSNDIAGMERDLKAILAINPKSATALNALGYTLADKTSRLEEAKEYIYQAYKIRPKDPAIIDSLGWIYYRLGEYAKAEVLLTQAYSLFQDQEVAAHLGEVLWIQNKKEQALKIWIDGLKRSPNSKKLIETMKRFNINVNIEKDTPTEPKPTIDHK
jgi:tetratricopeptide (TPR) repeat protein